jgi:hypothetical protein
MFLNMSDAGDGNNKDLQEIDLDDNAKLIYTHVLIKSSLLIHLPLFLLIH